MSENARRFEGSDGGLEGHEVRRDTFAGGAARRAPKENEERK